MYHDNVPIDALPKQMHALLVGAGEGSFIGRTVWQPTLRVLPDIALTYVCPSRSKESAERYRRLHDMDEGKVSHDFPSLLATAIGDGDPNELLVCIATETATHANLIIQALEAGARNIVCDKPLAPRIGDALRIRAAMEKAPDAQVYLTFNHRYNAAIFLLRKIVAQALAQGKPVCLDGAFHQNWLCGDTDSKQAKSRIGDEWCTLLDLGTHVADLLSFVVDRPITSVARALVSRDLPQPWEKTITGGECLLSFGDTSIGTSLSVNQCMEGDFLDDIWIKVTIPDDNVCYLWRMKECGGDNLLVGKAAARMKCRADWKVLERGASGFDPEVAAIFGMHPPGHGSCAWGMMWRYAFCAILGDCWRRQNLPILAEEKLEPYFKLPVPTFADAGMQTTLWAHAHVDSADQLDTKLAIPLAESRFREMD